MLFTHVLKITTTAASLAIDIVMYTKHNERHYSLVGLGMDAGLMFVNPPEPLPQHAFPD
jgi:hypothetical protein